MRKIGNHQFGPKLHLSYSRKQIIVSKRSFIESHIVNAHTEYTILFQYTKNGAAPGAGARMDNSLFQKIFNLSLHFLQIQRLKVCISVASWFCIWHKVDFQFNSWLRWQPARKIVRKNIRLLPYQ
jgi:hypothetical protein